MEKSVLEQFSGRKPAHFYSSGRKIKKISRAVCHDRAARETFLQFLFIPLCFLVHDALE